MAARHLILLRHATAVDRAATDAARTLTELGRREAARIGQRLLEKQVRPDVAVASPAARAWTTAVLACNQLGIPEAAILADRDIYQAEPQDLLDVIARHGGEATCLMLVGHNPGLSDLGVALVKDVPADWDLGRATAAWLTLDNSWTNLRKGAATLVDVLEP